MVKGYRTISLPASLLSQVEEFLEKHPEFTSVTDFVKYAVRKELDRLKDQESK
jgi:Arc/MetJ-type ribon-helix-helix transcriptional regulator